MNKILFILPLFLLACGISTLPTAVNPTPTIEATMPTNAPQKPAEGIVPPNTPRTVSQYPVRGNWHIRTCPAYACPLADPGVAYSGKAFTVLCVTDGWAMVATERWIHAGAFGKISVKECE